jgi:N-acetylglutamate synthase-like GNAT family acetyltransferase
VQYQLRSPNSESEWKAYYQLRWQVLRAPWQQPPGSEKDQLEKTAIHRMIIDKQQRVLAIGRLHFTDNNSAQIRYMAVLPDNENRGLASKILDSLEQVAINKNRKRIFLHARENARGFYLKQGYSVVEASHTLYNSIKHYLMEKTFLN